MTERNNCKEQFGPQRSTHRKLKRMTLSTRETRNTSSAWKRRKREDWGKKQDCCWEIMCWSSGTNGAHCFFYIIYNIDALVYRPNELQTGEQCDRMPVSSTSERSDWHRCWICQRLDRNNRTSSKPRVQWTRKWGPVECTTHRGTSPHGDNSHWMNRNVTEKAEANTTQSGECWIDHQWYSTRTSKSTSATQIGQMQTVILARLCTELG